MLVAVFLLSSRRSSASVCASVSVQENAAAGAVGAVHSQQAGRWAQHANHPQHPAGRRGYLHLQGHQQGGISGEGALPQSVW